MVPIDGFATSRSFGSVKAGLDRPPSGLRLRGGRTAGWVRGSSRGCRTRGWRKRHPPPPPDGGPRQSSMALMAFSPPLPRGQALKSLRRSDFAFGTARSPASGRGVLTAGPWIKPGNDGAGGDAASASVRHAVEVVFAAADAIGE